MEIKYTCHWPGCQYTTTNRDEIEYHHIIPKELGNRLNCNVVLSYCPTHHHLIWHPECKHGHHSINGPVKLQIHNIYIKSEQKDAMPLGWLMNVRFQYFVLKYSKYFYFVNQKYKN